MQLESKFFFSPTTKKTPATMNDPVREEEMARRNLGMARSLQLCRTNRPHPGRGGSQGYSVEMHLAEIQRFLLNQPTVASDASIYRWMNQLHPFLQGGESR